VGVGFLCCFFVDIVFVGSGVVGVFFFDFFMALVWCGDFFCLSLCFFLGLVGFFFFSLVVWFWF